MHIVFYTLINTYRYRRRSTPSIRLLTMRRHAKSRWRTTGRRHARGLRRPRRIVARWRSIATPITATTGKRRRWHIQRRRRRLLPRRLVHGRTTAKTGRRAVGIGLHMIAWRRLIPLRSARRRASHPIVGRCRRWSVS